MTRSVRDHFDEVATHYDGWKSKSHHYYAAVKRCVGEVVPTGGIVCEVGCGTGDVLAGLKPEHGIGIDISPTMIHEARYKYPPSKFPELTFEVHDIMAGPLEGGFQYVIAVDVAEHVADVGAAFRSMQRMLSPGGLLVVITANPSWSGILHLAERLRLKMPEGDHRWRSREDLAQAALASGLTEIAFARFLIIPKAVPVLSMVDRLPRMRPVIDRYGLIQRGIYNADVP